MEAANYLFMSSDSMENYKSVMEALHRKGKKLIVCTHGKKGATCLSEDGVWIERGVIENYEYKDANGAGDSFFAGFLYGYLHNKPIEKCLDLATICAGLCITSEQLAFPELTEELIWQENKKYFE
ncbi:PfkB family carbohydrate kinase [Fontibacillus phaseoli]